MPGIQSLEHDPVIAISKLMLDIFQFLSSFSASSIEVTTDVYAKSYTADLLIPVT